MSDEIHEDITEQDAELESALADLDAPPEADTPPDTPDVPDAETDVASGHTVPEPDVVEALAVDAPGGISGAPFLVYLALWVILCVAAVFLLRPAALDGGARWAPEYLYAIYAGIVMTGAGPLLSLVVWLVVRSRREPDERRGLFVSALVKGAATTFTGAVLWIVALYVLDLFASGALV